ncbi:hypothetical protein M2277_005070 [Paenibacillus sp. LBL]|uniref:hypothetical protein n=1 Tax=Paenibacillus sp. LBL TaxID=2940563 RepID=UPI0024759700|nr:hypothetical protein [Paenibacillus sp. LBL]MDH6674378.1 hypothetical protein [Paenibacillus sp. LBL]
MNKIIVTIMLMIDIITGTTPKGEAPITMTTAQIETVSYSEVKGIFYAYTVKDPSGMFWVIDVQGNKGESLQEFEKRVIGKSVDIYYQINEQYSDEYDIVKTKIY